MSQPKQYIGTHAVYWASLVLYYIFTVPGLFAHNLVAMYPLAILTVILHVAVQSLLVLLGRTNPGILPGIMHRY